VGRPDAETPFSPLTPGYRLDRYELLGPLAEGGMASVWIARQRGKHGFEKLVALKTILPQYASDLRFQQMFLDEARIASRIEHFNVARILDLGEEHDVLYLAMEYVDGDSLSKLRRAWQKKHVPAPTGVILRILADVCSGLHEAHELRGEDGTLLEIVHRDVSPHNILVSVKGVAKLIDFGIAKARDRLAGETNAGVLKGKIQYMAPEQALGRKVDRRADLWAVGATLYHVLTGKPPFDADNTLGTLHLLTSGRPPLPLPPTVHPAIANLARKALTTPPERRFSSAAEMRDAIEAAMLDARVATTMADVASFVVEHLGERTAKRRQTIDFALAAAAERERVEEFLKPAVERTDSGMTSVPGRTTAAAPDALRGATSQNTPPGVSPVESSPRPGTRASNPARTVLVAGFVGGAIALAGVGGLALLRSPGGNAARSSAGTSTVAAAPLPAALPAPPAAVSPPPSSSAPPDPSIPVFAADSLPKAGSLTQPTATQAGPPRGGPVGKPVPAPKRKKTVDDGF
jgi:serine/threonine-protein kinase